MILVLDAALDGCCAAVVDGDSVRSERRHGGGRGSAAALPLMAGAVLAEAGVRAPALSMVAVTIGPGSFTGVRAALALALGLGSAAGVVVRGVSVGQAIRAVIASARPVWVAVDSRRGRVFLDRDGEVVGVAPGEVPEPVGPVAVAGDAAIEVASRLAARGCDVQLLAARRAEPLGIARAAVLGGRGPLPLYVDGVEARPGGELRPAPA